jgi:cobalt-zinc-cadmium efflux system membrane fusion protein
MRPQRWATPPLALLLLLAGCGGGEREAAEDAAAEHAEEAHVGAPGPAGEELLVLDSEMLRDLKLTTFAAELRPGGEGVTALGELRVNDRAYAEVGSPIPARVLRLLVEPGAAVGRGTPLAELQSAELGRTRAEHVAARARAELARQTVERKRGLAAERIVSRGELERAEADLAATAAELLATRAALAALGVGGEAAAPADSDLSRFLLRAPLAGTVLERRAVRGQGVDPAQTLFRIAELSRLWLVVQAPEQHVVHLREGARAQVTLAALPGRRFAGEIAWTGREVDPHSRTVPVRIVLANPGLLKPGMFATAWLETGAAGDQVVAVPASALQRLEDRWVVFLPRGRVRFAVRPVGRGRDLGGEVAILSGLAPGELVIDEGAFLLRAEAEKRAGGGEHHH